MIQNKYQEWKTFPFTFICYNLGVTKCKVERKNRKRCVAAFTLLNYASGNWFLRKSMNIFWSGILKKKKILVRSKKKIIIWYSFISWFSTIYWWYLDVFFIIFFCITVIQIWRSIKLVLIDIFTLQQLTITGKVLLTLR